MEYEDLVFGQYINMVNAENRFFDEIDRMFLLLGKNEKTQSEYKTLIENLEKEKNELRNEEKKKVIYYFGQDILTELMFEKDMQINRKYRRKVLTETQDFLRRNGLLQLREEKDDGK